MTQQLTIVTFTHICGHQTARPIFEGTEQVIRESCAAVACQPCRKNRMEPIRFAAGWKYRR